MKKIFIAAIITAATLGTTAFALGQPGKLPPYFPEPPKQVGDVVEFIDTKALEFGHDLGIIKLEENQNTIELKCTKTTNELETYYISVDIIGKENTKLVKSVGPIRTSDFKITGLEGGKSYRVQLATRSNMENVSGTLTAARTEVKK